MPLYEIQHNIRLTESQKDDLAEAITRIHSIKFSTPRLFVNVTYTDVTDKLTYVAGKRHSGNHIRANVRAGPSRTQEDWNDLCAQIQQAWDKIIGKGLPKVRRSDPDQDMSLRSLILLGDIIGGSEVGVALPPAGGDVQWLRDNWELFNKRAQEGDEDFKSMVQEVKERGLLNESNGASAQQKLEEAMGWGEYA